MRQPRGRRWWWTPGFAVLKGFFVCCARSCRHASAPGCGPSWDGPQKEHRSSLLLPQSRERVCPSCVHPWLAVCASSTLTWQGPATYFERRVQRLSIPLRGRHLSGGERCRKSASQAVSGGVAGLRCFPGSLAEVLGTFDNGVARSTVKAEMSQLRCVGIWRWMVDD